MRKLHYNLIHLFWRNSGENVGQNNVLFLRAEHAIRLEFAASDGINGKGSSRICQSSIFDGKRDGLLNLPLDLVEKDPGVFMAIIDNVSDAPVTGRDEVASRFEGFIAKALDNCRKMSVNLDDLRLVAGLLACQRQLLAPLANGLFNVVSDPRLRKGDDDGRVVAVAEGMGVSNDSTQFLLPILVLCKEDVLRHDFRVDEGALDDLRSPFSAV